MDRSEFWVIPNILLEQSWGFSSHELNEIEKIIEKKKALIRSKWDEFFIALKMVLKPAKINFSL